MRVQRLKREAATYIMLRRKGYSINKLASIFGRSTSVIHRILKVVGLTGYTISGYGYVRYKLWNPNDMRKSGGIVASVSDLFRSKRMVKIFQGWAAFMDGEVDKPP